MYTSPVLIFPKKQKVSQEKLKEWVMEERSRSAHRISSYKQQTCLCASVGTRLKGSLSLPVPSLSFSHSFFVLLPLAQFYWEIDRQREVRYRCMPYFAVYNAHPWFSTHYTQDYLCPWCVIIMPMYNMHPYFSLKNLGQKKVCILHGKIWYFLCIMSCYITLYYVKEGIKWIFVLQWIIN